MLTSLQLHFTSLQSFSQHICFWFQELTKSTTKSPVFNSSTCIISMTSKDSLGCPDTFFTNAEQRFTNSPATQPCSNLGTKWAGEASWVGLKYASILPIFCLYLSIYLSIYIYLNLSCLNWSIVVLSYLFLSSHTWSNLILTNLVLSYLLSSVALSCLAIRESFTIYLSIHQSIKSI